MIGAVVGPRSVYSVTTLAEYEAYCKRMLVKHGQPPIISDYAFGTPTVYVNAGRLLMQCLTNEGLPDEQGRCGAIIPADPEWLIAICPKCGTRYQIVLPDQWEEAERVLSERPVANRNWYPNTYDAFRHQVFKLRDDMKSLRGETIADLVAENAAHPPMTIEEQVREFERKLRAGEL